MNIEERIDSIAADIQRQIGQLQVYRELARIFKGINFPEEMYVYAYKYSDGNMNVDFSANQEGKDLRPLVHQICRKLHVKFSKEKNYTETALEYKAHYPLSEYNLLTIKVTGVVPSSCHFEEIIEVLSEEEVAEKRAKVETTRVTRKIVCK